MISKNDTTACLSGPGDLLRRTTAVVILLLLLWPPYARSQSMEYLLKAGFLEKFARFTDWPETTVPADPGSPFVISVIGESPLQGSLEKLYATEKIKNRPVTIRYISSPAGIDGSDLVFIAESEKKHLDKLLEVTRGKPILTVGDTKDFARRGCHINFYITAQGTLHFEINLAKVKESGLHMQLVLLEIAKIID